MTTDQQAGTIGVSTQRCEQLLRQIVGIRSVVGEDTTAHLWMTERLRELGMTVEQYAVEGRRTPLVLGTLEGDDSKPGVLFDAHYDTVGAAPGDWSRDPWGAQVDDGVLYGRGAVDSKGALVAMLAAIEALVTSGEDRHGPIYFMSDCDGEDSFRGATLMTDLGVIERLGTVFSAEATATAPSRSHIPASQHGRSPRSGKPRIRPSRSVASMRSQRWPGSCSRWSRVGYSFRAGTRSGSSRASPRTRSGRCRAVGGRSPRAATQC
jgi:hypothetical protein